MGKRYFALDQCKTQSTTTGRTLGSPPICIELIIRNAVRIDSLRLTPTDIFHINTLKPRYKKLAQPQN